MVKNISFLILCVLFLGAFVGCDKEAVDSSDNQTQTAIDSFDFGALKSEAEAQNIDLSKILLKDSPKDLAQDSPKKARDLAQDSRTNPSNAPQITKSMAQFYLLDGEILGEKATLYLKISSTASVIADIGENQSNAIAYITGKIVRGAEVFTLKGEVEPNQTTAIALNITNDNNLGAQKGAKEQIFEVQIAKNGEVSGKFVGNDFFADGTEAHFKRAQGKINDIVIFGVSVAQKHTGKDFDGSSRDFDFNVATQIPLIRSDDKINFALDKINSTLREIAMPETSDYGDDSTNFSSVSTFDIDYIDEKIIVFGNYNYLYSGGAHGNYSDDAISFDINSGEKLANEANALLADENAPELRAMIKARLKADYDESVDENATLSRFRIRPNGVEFYWGIYEIAPYAAGIISIYFDFSELAPFVRKDSPYAYLFAKNM